MASIPEKKMSETIPPDSPLMPTIRDYVFTMHSVHINKSGVPEEPLWRQQCIVCDDKGWVRPTEINKPKAPLCKPDEHKWWVKDEVCSLCSVCGGLCQVCGTNLRVIWEVRPEGRAKYCWTQHVHCINGHTNCIDNPSANQRIRIDPCKWTVHKSVFDHLVGLGPSTKPVSVGPPPYTKKDIETIVDNMTARQSGHPPAASEPNPLTDEDLIGMDEETKAAPIEPPPRVALMEGNRNCDHCEKPEEVLKPLKRCSKCRYALYCDNGKCQQAAWPMHKLICNKVLRKCAHGGSRNSVGYDKCISCKADYDADMEGWHGKILLKNGGRVPSHCAPEHYEGLTRLAKTHKEATDRDVKFSPIYINLPPPTTNPPRVTMAVADAHYTKTKEVLIGWHFHAKGGTFQLYANGAKRCLESPNCTLKWSTPEENSLDSFDRYIIPKAETKAETKVPVPPAGKRWWHQVTEAERLKKKPRPLLHLVEDIIGSKEYKVANEPDHLASAVIGILNTHSDVNIGKVADVLQLRNYFVYDTKHGGVVRLQRVPRSLPIKWVIRTYYEKSTFAVALALFNHIE
jgi:hypothetical protein